MENAETVGKVPGSDREVVERERRGERARLEANGPGRPACARHGMSATTVPTSPLDPCDVLVVGSGIAGTMAAWSAARAGARVTLACAGRLFSGSSFYPGTWGLGLVGPESAGDESDLVRTICDVGGGVADEGLVHSFVSGINESIGVLEGLGVKLDRPAQAGEQAYVPCFDHKHRSWHGLRREAFVGAMGPRLRELGVRVLEGRELVDLVDGGHGVAGAVLHAGQQPDVLEVVHAGAVVLACGGYATLFERHLAPGDVLGCAQAIARAHGAELTNLEFMQIMPGLVAPRPGVVFNEKTFRIARLAMPDGTLPFGPGTAGSCDPVVAERSTHGPFTSRLASRAVDLAIAECGTRGMTVTYPGLGDDPGDGLPEFVRTFFDWMASIGIGAGEELRIAHYAHAANGGIRIAPDGSSAADGLFACGEGTGGMHGADRLGGLSSANGLVFGLRAGESAAGWALGHPTRAQAGAPDAATMLAHAGLSAADPDAAAASQARRDIDRRLRHAMTESCMVIRDARGLTRCLATLDALAAELAERGACASDAASLASTLRGAHRLELARAVASAQLARPQSLGSHYRADARRSAEAGAAGDAAAAGPTAR